MTTVLVVEDDRKLRELLRIEAILRRTSVRDAGPPPDGRERFGDGHLVLDPARREAWVAGRAVGLTVTEWGLLSALSRSGGKVCSRAELVNRIRGEEVDANDRSIHSHVNNLRLGAPGWRCRSSR